MPGPGSNRQVWPNPRAFMRSYTLGLAIVLAAVGGSGLLCLYLVPVKPQTASRAGESLALQLGPIELVKSSGRPVGPADFGQRVFITSFIFTRCKLECPRISAVMKSIQDRVRSSEVMLASITVDPDYDTPEVLSAYARRFGADPSRWWFLRADKDRTYDLIRNQFKLAVDDQGVRAEGELVDHSSRLVLVDHGVIVGSYDSTDGEAVDRVVARAVRLAQPAWVRAMPRVNAFLNALCAVFLVAGWLLIRARGAARAESGWTVEPAREVAASTLGQTWRTLTDLRARGHVICMVMAVTTSTLFLTCYLIYHARAGSVPYPHQGASRIVYFTILTSHTLLATLGVVPLVLLTLIRALRGDYARHARIASVTLPIWLYVSITGVVIYWMLYQMGGQASL